MLLPAFRDDEQRWPTGLRIVLYFCGLFWCFLGVALIADVFMGAIERVTSKKLRKYSKKTKRYQTMTIWNPTIANLTLMALGSSAPEILLSVIELFGGGMQSGELGPSTIVGSAAFNLLCISAVCISAIPAGETRRIKEMPVYCITASFSIFAYIWLLFILQGPSPNVVDIWEGVLTFLFFPMMVALAFVADKGWLSSAGKEEEKPLMGPDMTAEELSAITLKIRQQYGENLSETQVVKLLSAEYGPKPTRAAYRVGAMRDMTGGKKVERLRSEDLRENVVISISENAKELEVLTAKSEAQIGFRTTRFAVFENVGALRLPVCRWGETNCPVVVSYKTRDGTASGGTDYEVCAGTLRFESGETEKLLEVKVLDDCAQEDDEEFYVDVFNPCCPDGGLARIADTGSSATVVIIDDDLPGVLRFECEEVKVAEQVEDSKVEILVLRANGCCGKVGCQFRTEDGSACAGADYDESSGTVTFEDGQMSTKLAITIKARGRFDVMEDFRVIMTEPFGGATFDKQTDGGGDACVCTVQVHADGVQKEKLLKVQSMMLVNWDKTQLGHSNWKSQFHDAIYVNGGEDGDVSWMELVMHILSLPWKVLFALVPPVDYADGWICFFSALAMIGGVTAIIGDLAGLLGCVMGIKPQITAITFVALGTSLPDTFASKVAAVEAPTADASIGNITGSNSVNVFLGLGLPWMIGGFYWSSTGPTADWASKYPDVALAYSGEARFVVEAGSLGFSVTVFVVCGVSCMALLFVRRLTCGGELGGPPQTKLLSALFLVFLWCLYVGLSAWKAMQEVCD